MSKIKQLNETRGAKLKEAAALDTSKAEDRSKLQALHTEIEGIDQAIMLEARQLELAGQKVPHLSKGEKRDLAGFDYGSVVRTLHENINGGNVRFEGIEAEMIEEGRKEARAAGVPLAGIQLPRLLVRQRENRDMTATGTTSVTGDQGGMTIATAKAGLLDDFFNASIMRTLLGATVIEGLVGNLDVPRLTAGTAPSKKAENAAADEVTPTTAMLSLNPNRLPAYIDISEALLKQSSAGVEAVLRAHLTNQMLAVQEAAFFHGTGTNEAEGIAATSGIGSVAGGTNGAAPTLAHIVSLEEKVDATNALLGRLHYASNGQIRAKLKTTPVVASTDSRMLLGDARGATLNSYDPIFTNAISRTLTKGTASGVCSAIFFGNFTDYWIGYWGGISLEMVRDKTNAIGGLYTLVASTYYDGGVVRPKSFAAMLDALGA